jgi:hypothetical protein
MHADDLDMIESLARLSLHSDGPARPEGERDGGQREMAVNTKQPSTQGFITHSTSQQLVLSDNHNGGLDRQSGHCAGPADDGMAHARQLHRPRRALPNVHRRLQGPAVITTPPTLAPTASAGSDLNDNLDSASDDSSSTSNTTGQGGLSTGVVAGVGVGAAIGGILFMAVVGWLWWTCVRKKRQSNTGILTPPAAPGKEHDMGYYHSDDTWMAAHPYNQELPVPAPYQIPYSAARDPYYSNVRPELSDTRTPVELATPESAHPGPRPL